MVGDDRLLLELEASQSNLEPSKTESKELKQKKQISRLMLKYN